MFKAILQHIVLLLALRHDGTGLPANGPIPLLLSGVGLLIATTRTLVEFKVPGIGGIAILLGLVSILIVRKGMPAMLAPASLIIIGGDGLAIVIASLGGPELVLIAITLWEAIAMVRMAKLVMTQ